MAYVDLNPVRAGIAPAPESSNFTSIQIRIKAMINGEQTLAKFIGDQHKHKPKAVNVSLQDYLTLVDETGRVIRAGKGSAISQQANLSSEDYTLMMRAG
jgi:hypothetical protein